MSRSWLTTKENVPSYVIHPFTNDKYHFDPSYTTAKPNVKTNFKTNFKTFATCFYRAITSFHSETINIYTMLFAALCSSCFYISRDTTTTNSYFWLWLSCVMQCPFSIAFHAFMPMGKKVYDITCALDMTFITINSNILLYALSFPLSTFQRLFLQLVCLWLSYIALKEISCMLHRNVVSGTLFLPYLMPLVGLYLSPILYFQPYLWLQIVCVLGVSAMVILVRLPERILHKRIILNSHEFMHIGIIIAHVLEYRYMDLMVDKMYHKRIFCQVDKMQLCWQTNTT